MRSEEVAQQNKACCSEGEVKLHEYTGRGEVISLPDGMKIYRVGKEHRRGVICVYDIFGFEIGNTRHFCDLISESGLHVMMPDFFNGKPYDLKNFPPANMSDIVDWVEMAGTWEIVEKALTGTADLLKKCGVEDKIGILGFCWGGKEVLRACGSMPNLFSAGVAIHGSFLTPEMTERVNCPLMMLPSGSDPSIEPLKEVLDKKPFAAANRYHRFDTQIHGFASARGDWTDTETKTCVDKAICMTKEFFGNHVH